MDIKLKIKSWDDISINTFKKLKAIAENDSLEPMDKDIETIALFCGVTADDIYNMPMMQLSSLKDEIDEISKIKPEEKKSDGKLKYQNIKIGEYVCKCEVDLQNMTVSQYIDFQQYYSKGLDEDSLAKMISVFLIPSGCTYNEGYDIIDFINQINEHLSYRIANELCFFIFGQLQSSTKDTLISLDCQLKKMSKMKEMKPKKDEIKTARKKLKDLIFTIGL